jgi:hypothetical protein
MKTVISSDKSREEVGRSWLKALARRLRDWLNGFLLEPSRSAIDGDHGREGASSPVSSARAVQGQDPSATPGRTEQTDSLAQDLARDAGPPEEWLAIVREIAPELLLPVEEGGRPWRGVSSATREESQPAEEPLSPATVPPRDSGPQHFSPRIFAPIPEGEEAKPAQKRFPSPLPAAQKSEKHAEQVAPPAPGSRRSEPIKHGLAEAWPKAPASRFPSKANVVEKEKTRLQSKEESQASAPSDSRTVRSAKWTESEAQKSEAYHLLRESAPERDSSFRRPAARRFPAEVHRALAEQRVTLQRAERTFGGVSRGSESAAAKPEFVSTGQSKLEKRLLPTAPVPPDALEVSPRESQKPERDDPWPELPESQPVASTSWGEFLRSSEHLRALDLEQRGGR